MAKINKDGLCEKVYETIKRMMLDGVLVPGMKIDRKNLVEAMGVSQTPITEALNRLIGEGLIEQRPREGLFLIAFTYDNLRDLFAVRAGIEGIAVRLLVEELDDEQLNGVLHFFEDFSAPMDNEETMRYLKADQKFHERIIELSRNSIIANSDKTYSFLTKSYQKGLIRPPEETLEEHRKIVAAIRNRDAQKAQELMVEHFMKSRMFIKDKHLDIDKTQSK